MTVIRLVHIVLYKSDNEAAAQQQSHHRQPQPSFACAWRCCIRNTSECGIRNHHPDQAVRPFTQNRQRQPRSSRHDRDERKQDQDGQCRDPTPATGQHAMCSPAHSPLAPRRAKHQCNLKPDREEREHDEKQRRPRRDIEDHFIPMMSTGMAYLLRGPLTGTPPLPTSDRGLHGSHQLALFGSSIDGPSREIIPGQPQIDKQPRWIFMKVQAGSGSPIENAFALFLQPVKASQLNEDMFELPECFFSRVFHYSPSHSANVMRLPSGSRIPNSRVPQGLVDIGARGWTTPACRQTSCRASIPSTRIRQLVFSG